MKMRAKTRNIAFMEGVTAGILFGTSSIFTRFLVELNAFSITFWRLTIASLVLIVLASIFRVPFHLNLTRKSFKEIFALGIFLCLHFIFFTLAVKDTTILNATVLVNMTPIFSAIISILLFRLKPSRIAVLSLTISFVGVCLIAYSETITPKTSFQAGVSPTLKGDLEAMFAALLIAFYLNYGKSLRSRIDVFSSIVPIYLIAAVLAVILGLPFIGTSSLPTEPTVALFLIGLGLIPTAVAHTLYFSSLSGLKSFEAATIALLEPIGATFLGAIIFKEIPAYLAILGAFLVLFGVALIARQKE
ncbi:MAG: DMT family transporter [Candidatus Bathyarchaeia archaeon]